MLPSACLPDVEQALEVRLNAPGELSRIFAKSDPSRSDLPSLARHAHLATAGSLSSHVAWFVRPARGVRGARGMGRRRTGADVPATARVHPRTSCLGRAAISSLACTIQQYTYGGLHQGAVFASAGSAVLLWPSQRDHIQFRLSLYAWHHSFSHSFFFLGLVPGWSGTSRSSSL